MPVRTEPIGDFAKIFAGMPTKSSDRQEVGRWGNVLTVRSLTGTGIDLSQLEEHGVVGRSVDQYQVQTGDLLLSARSTSLKTAIVPKELDGCLINATLIGVRCLPKLLPRLLAAWLDGPEGQAALQAVSQSGTLQMNITVAGLSKIMVPVPPMETQRQLVALLEVADEAHLAAVQAAEDRHQLATQIVAERLK
jgi:hypothetical protein